MIIQKINDMSTRVYVWKNELYNSILNETIKIKCHRQILSLFWVVDCFHFLLSLLNIGSRSLLRYTIQIEYIETPIIASPLYFCTRSCELRVLDGEGVRDSWIRGEMVTSRDTHGAHRKAIIFNSVPFRQLFLVCPLG